MPKIEQPHQYGVRRPLGLVIALVLAGLTTAALADDYPRRKPGLWEVKTNSTAAGGHASTIQQCVDEKTDNLMAQQGQSMAKDRCSRNSVRRSGDRVNVDSVCKFEGTTATTQGTFTGSFDSTYRGDIDVTYDPPMMGMKQARTTLEARWLGPCKPGQKAGDVVIPGMGAFNVPEMMKNMPANVQDLMKNLPQR